MEGIEDEKNGRRLVVKRVLRGTGLLDGLGVERRPGDVDYMVVGGDDWWISHNYYRGDKWLGTYVNINTPPEILPDTIKYHDLAVDIVIKPDGNINVIDIDELDKYHEEGIITDELYMEARRAVDGVTRQYEKYLYKAKQ